MKTASGAGPGLVLNLDGGRADWRHYVAVGLILATWLALVLFVSSRHEFFRDEIRALSIALEPDSILELPGALRNEGHPVLWYALLRIGYAATGSQGVVLALSVIIAFAAVLLFLSRAPFPLWQKVLFAFGIPLWTYSVSSRNYGISMLLFFLFAALYPRRKQHPLLLGLVAAALANTNVHSCILACLLVALWCGDEFETLRASPWRQSVLLGGSLGLALVGVAVRY